MEEWQSPADDRSDIAIIYLVLLVMMVPVRRNQSRVQYFCFGGNKRSNVDVPRGCVLKGGNGII